MGTTKLVPKLQKCGNEMGVVRQRGPARSLKDLKREISARNGEPLPPPRSSHKHKPAEVKVVKMISDFLARKT